MKVFDVGSFDYYYVTSPGIKQAR